jgi:NAD(P)-dependent dehydrogenase (short-subunit alcohol dehydrogenase family)
MLASDAHEKYTQEDMTFDSLASINMDRTFLKRYGIISFALVKLGQSKLAAVIYTRTLSNKLSDRQIFVNAVNPGDVATD